MTYTPEKTEELLNKFISPDSLKRYDIINYLISKYNYKRYLEIGVNDGKCIGNIIIESKTGVEPSFFAEGYDLNSISGITHRLTSDDFFNQNTERFDIVFIDGLHESHQVDKDIMNAYSCLSENGTIVLHDCLPLKENFQKVPRVEDMWNGDVWKSIVKLRYFQPYLDICVVEEDCGVGIIRNGSQMPYRKTDIGTCLTWEYFSNDMIDMLNIITKEQFYNKF